MKTSKSLIHLRPLVLLSQAGSFAIAVAMLAINNVPIRADLVAHWSFDEAGGTVAHDSASGLDGTLSASGASFVSGGISSNAISLSRAANGLVNMGNVLALGSGDFSVVAWVKMNPGDTTPDTIILSKHQSGHANGYFLVVNQSGGGGQDDKALFYAGGLAADGPVSTSSVNDGSWHQVVGVYKAGVNKVIYVDGMAQGTNSAPAIDGNTVAFVIGGMNVSGPAGFYAGLIDDVQVYNHALSSSNILYLFQNPGKVLLAPPSILSQPTDQVATIGGTAEFSVVAGGTPPFSYQWRKNATNIVAATNATFSLTNLQFNDAGDYSVVVSNALDSVTSSNATLAVTPAPICVTPPSGLVSWWSANSNALDSASSSHGTLAGNAAFGTGRVGQGFLFDGSGDGVRIASPTNLQLQNFTIETWVKRASTARASFDFNGGIIFGFGPGGYNLAIFDDGTPFVGRLAVDYVTPTTSLADTNFHHLAVTKSGVNVVFYVDGAAYPAPSYSSVFTFTTPVAIGARGDNLANSFYGSVDELALYNRALSAAEIQSIYNANSAGKCAIPPAIASQPESQTAPVGAKVTFAVVATGSSPFSYQWRKNGTNIVAATNATLNLTNLQLSDSGDYSVVVSNTADAATSSNATLTVTPFPVCVAPRAGLVGWWSGEGNALDNKGTNEGTLNGNATYGPGRVGQGFVFDGLGDGVGIGNPTNLQLQTFTIETWFKRASTNRATSDPGYQNGGFLHYGIGGYGFGPKDDGRLLLTKVGSSETFSSVLRATDTNLHHAAVTKSGSSVIFYLDGVPEAAGPYDPGFVFNSPVAIGARGGDMGNAFLGIIDELAVYNRALSPGEIQSIYNASIAGKCAIPPVIASQPESQTAPLGAKVTFTVLATGGPLNYQWRRNGTNLLAATNTTLSLTNLQLSDSGDYSVLVSNVADSVTSSNATLTVTPFPVCVAPRSGLVSWWPGEVNTFDSAGTNHGTLNGNATFGPGQVEQGFVFDGNGDGVRVGNPPRLQLQDFTIEAWIKRSSATTVSSGPGVDALFFSYGQGGYGFGLDRTSGQPLLSRIGVNAAIAGAAVSDTNFHHLAVTKSGANVVFYVDGEAYPAPSYSSTFTFTTLAAIGARGDNLTGGFYGSVDELAVYNRALSPVEIQAIYNAGNAGKCALPPTILTQPRSQTVRVDTNVTFNVVATGTSLLNYQWRFNAANIVGATNSSLVLSNVQPATSGNYTVVVTNSINSITSAPASLSVRYIFVFGNGQNLTNAQYTFVGPVNVQLQTFFTNGALFYTLDGSQPSFASTQYTGPFAVMQSSFLRVITYSANFLQSWEIDPISFTIIPTYSLQASTAGGGTVSVFPANGPYLSNTVVNVTASPASGWTFLGWLGDASGANTNISVTMNRNRSVQARFGTTLNTTVAGSGAVTLTPPGGFYPFGTVVQIYAVPQSGNYFALWGDAGGGSSSNPLNFVLTNANPTVSSLFASLGAGEFALTVIPNGFGQITVNPPANRYTGGQNVTLTPVPNAGQQFMDWSGDATGTSSPLIIVMNQSKSIVASFTRRPGLSVFGALNGLNEQGLRLTLTGEFGGHYRIDGSTNLLDWTQLVTLTNTFGTTQFTDGLATNMPLRFYKAVAVP